MAKQTKKQMTQTCTVMHMQANTESKQTDTGFYRVW